MSHKAIFAMAARSHWSETTEATKTHDEIMKKSWRKARHQNVTRLDPSQPWPVDVLPGMTAKVLTISSMVDEKPKGLRS